MQIWVWMELKIIYMLCFTKYRVTLVVGYPGWVDFNLESSAGWWAATVVTYCPSRVVEHPKSKLTQPRYSLTTVCFV